MNSGSLRAVWGLAKSPELKMTDEELHLFVQANTGKDSLKKLTDREIKAVTALLGNLKESSRREERRQEHKQGNTATEHQRKKVYYLAAVLGWNKPERINGFCKRMFKVDRVEWLDYQQCSKLIEILKKMGKEKEKKHGGLQNRSGMQK